MRSFLPNTKDKNLTQKTANSKKIEYSTSRKLERRKEIFCNSDYLIK